MPTYILKIANSDCNSAQEFNKVLSAGTEASNSISVNATQGGPIDVGQAVTPTGVPNNADWETGVITVEVNVTTSDMNMDLAVAAERVSSSCGFQENTSSTSFQTLGSTGVHNFTIPTKNWAAGSAGDRIVITFHFFTTSHGGADVVIETGTTDAEIVTVISEGATAQTASVAAATST
ncbi:MAG: hypothetical protein E2O95_00605, partial [Acidobacteria bacterium]